MKKIVIRFLQGIRDVPRFFGGLFRSKYTELILAVSLFIILDAGVLIINFYTSYQIANDAHAIQLASRMGTLSQSLLHELYQVHEDARLPDAPYMETIDVFAKTYKLFDETLDAFIYGGDLIGQGQDQDDLLKDTVYRNTSAHLLKDAEDIWKVYRVKLKPIVYAYFNDAEREDIITATTAALSYSREQSGKLLEIMQSFAGAVEGVAQRKAERLRSIQSIGISLAVINFFLILFHFLKRLNHSDALIEKARRETANILKNVNEGLFLLDRTYVIGSQHSKSLEALFQNDHLAGQNFVDLLRPLVTEKTLETVEEYAEILFSPRVNESLIVDLNPLNRVEIHLSGDGASFDVRYFSFQFARVYEKKELNSLLVTVKDITELVQLSEQLKEANDKVNKEVGLLLAIIHVDSGILNTFLRSTEEGLQNVNNVLKTKAKGAEGLTRKLEQISRTVHKLKGDSTVLGLDFVVDKFHAFELATQAVKEKRNLSGQDFLPLVVHLNQLMTEFTIIRTLTDKMSTSDRSTTSQDALLAPLNDASVATMTNLLTGIPWISHLRHLVDQVASDHEKQAELDTSDFDMSLLSTEQEEPVKDIIVQNLRNAVAHGIEPPAIRQRSGKPPTGTIKMALTRNGNGLQLSIRDDGQGIDLEKIKSTALSKRLATESQLDQCQPNQLLSFLFRHGFTTRGHADKHAGQGIGMDLVKSRLKSLNGKVRVKFQPGSYTEFLYTFETGNKVVQ